MPKEIFKAEKPEGEKEIVEHDFEMMNTEMPRLLNRESLSGNAGTVEIEGKRYSCGAANGIAKLDNGKILAFGNFQDLAEEILKNPENGKISLRVAVDNMDKPVKQWRGFFKVVETLYLSQGFSEDAKRNIKEAASKYNEEHK